MTIKKNAIIIGILVIIAAAVLAAYYIIPLQKLKNKDLLKVRWGYGGGMTGGHSSIEIRRDGDNAIIVTEEQEWHNSDLTRVTYTVSADVLDELKDLIIKANVPALDKRGFSRYIAYDAETYSFSCSFEGGNYYSVSQNQKSSASESRLLLDIKDYMYSLTKGEGETEVIQGTPSDSD